MRAILGLYFSASMFFFAFPCLHRPLGYRAPLFGQVLSSPKVLTICHRGNPRRVAENTLASFQSCVEIGDMLQMDVCQTKDGVLVVHHDKDLLRTCGVAKQISELNYKELPNLQASIAIDFDTPGKRVLTNCQRIPTLSQVFQRFPKTPMNIELKTPSIASTDQLLSQLKISNREDITVVGIRNIQSRYLSQTASKAGIMQFMSDRKVFRLLLLYFSGLLPFASISEQVLQIPLYTSNFYEWKRQEWASPIKTTMFFTTLKLLNYLMIPMVWHLKKRGIMTFYWVCNNEEQFQRALFCGASGIITDEPKLLRSFLNQRRRD